MAVQQPDGGQPLWTVGVPRQTTIPDPQRGFVAGWEIPVVMADGSTFTVTVDSNSFNPQAVQSVIQDHVSRYTMIRGLQGEPF